MGKYRALLRLARRIGPAIVFVITRYGPQLRALIRENPQIVSKIQNRMHQLAGKNPHEREARSLGGRIEILKEHVTYLYASANTPEIAEKAAAWRAELDSIDRAIPVLDAMARTQRLSEQRKLSKRIDALSQSILSASLSDYIEDAIIDDDAAAPGNAAPGDDATPGAPETDSPGTNRH
ncbi:hypothetical protein ACXITP_02800 [Actinotignum sanguinis]|uniref:Uncharacterized protein n=2 Tax=Actinomycetaceae TaxID=2049 RepID=A0ABZ0RBX2_9ACTO|nr:MULTISPECIES: hypothetical protein [Actinotignum]WPJ89602.1 hypothetical protein R0V15_03145 [Schaalia turicensis]MDE1553338.1 hypothetical protein [Actinotignum sanguinis]MDE1566027.1 hypothetical protein [Actinotignum sanguinis]MDE1577060.1 hypothetical protein [Actinotignum sanguinis]MDE1642495.1 hypothetical protein [Actinotignum sanguinis]